MDTPRPSSVSASLNVTPVKEPNGAPTRCSAAPQPMQMFSIGAWRRQDDHKPQQQASSVEMAIHSPSPRPAAEVAEALDSSVRRIDDIRWMEEDDVEATCEKPQVSSSAFRISQQQQQREVSAATAACSRVTIYHKRGVSHVEINDENLTGAKLRQFIRYKERKYNAINTLNRICVFLVVLLFLDAFLHVMSLSGEYWYSFRRSSGGGGTAALGVFQSCPDSDRQDTCQPLLSIASTLLAVTISTTDVSRYACPVSELESRVSRLWAMAIIDGSLVGGAFVLAIIAAFRPTRNMFYVWIFSMLVLSIPFAMATLILFSTKILPCFISGNNNCEAGGELYDCSYSWGFSVYIVSIALSFLSSCMALSLRSYVFGLRVLAKKECKYEQLLKRERGFLQPEDEEGDATLGDTERLLDATRDDGVEGGSGDDRDAREAGAAVHPGERAVVKSDGIESSSRVFYESGSEAFIAAGGPILQGESRPPEDAANARHRGGRASPTDEASRIDQWLAAAVEATAGVEPTPLLSATARSGDASPNNSISGKQFTTTGEYGDGTPTITSPPASHRQKCLQGSNPFPLEADDASPRVAHRCDPQDTHTSARKRALTLGAAPSSIARDHRRTNTGTSGDSNGIDGAETSSKDRVTMAAEVGGRSARPRSHTRIASGDSSRRGHHRELSGASLASQRSSLPPPHLFITAHDMNVVIEGAEDWVYVDESDMYYSFQLQMFWDPINREYYSCRLRQWQEALF